MVDQTEALLKQVQEMIASCTSRSDFATVGRLAELAVVIQSKIVEAERLRVSLDSIRREFDEICTRDSGLRSVPPVNRPLIEAARDKKDQSCIAPMAIEVRWYGENSAVEPELIALSSAAATMRCFLERVLATKGNRDFERLASIRTGRGPLVSTSPSTDYVNRTTGTLYTHHRLGESEWHVITHSSTREKVEQVSEVLRVLGLKNATIRLADEFVNAAQPRNLDDTDDGKI